MNKIHLLLIIVVATVCASSVSYEPKVWSEYTCSGFSQTIDTVAGGGAIDCGFYDQTKRDSKSLKKKLVLFLIASKN